MRNLPLWFAAGLSLQLAIFAFAVLRIALTESLWLDELHTSWSVSGPWHEIASRAAAGNQTPLYFWFLGLLTQTLGGPNGENSEWILRSPSVVAWLLVLSLVAWKVHSKATSSEATSSDQRSWLFSLCIVAWIVLDRLQWFYASEARPYAFVQLVSLAGWCCVEEFLCATKQLREGTTAGDLKTTRLKTAGLIVLWCILSVANIYLHLTAALPVLFQWLVGCVGASWQDKKASLAGRWCQAIWILAALGVTLAVLPIVQLAFPVWQRRAQWATFASDVSMYRAASMFPFVPVLLCVVIGCVVDRLLHRKVESTLVVAEVRWLWWTAMLGPWLLAWVLTASGVAPIFHPRFVLASALPLFVVGAIELRRCQRWAIRWLTCVAVALAIVFSQGSVSIWRGGYLVGNLRGEDWRSATQWVNAQHASADALLCSSGLIEANASATEPHTLPLDSKFAEYLSFPLLGVYRIADASGRTVPVTPLLGDHRQWAAQIAERMASEQNQISRLWMFYRGAPGRLRTKLGEMLEDLKAKDVEFEAAEPARFGNLYVVELKIK